MFQVLPHHLAAEDTVGRLALRHRIAKVARVALLRVRQSVFGRQRLLPGGREKFLRPAGQIRVPQTHAQQVGAAAVRGTDKIGTGHGEEKSSGESPAATLRTPWPTGNPVCAGGGTVTKIGSGLARPGESAGDSVNS